MKGNVFDNETSHIIIPLEEAAAAQPVHFLESPLQVYSILVPYQLMGGALALIQTMYLIKALFVVLSVMLVYLFTERVTRDYKASLCAVGILAVIPTATLVQAFDELAGDFFTPILLMVALWFLLDAWQKKGTVHLITSLAFLGLSVIFWNGGAYALFSYAIAAILLTQYQKLGIKKAITLAVAATFILFPIYYIIAPYLNTLGAPFTAVELSNITAPNAQANIYLLNFYVLISQQLLFFVWPFIAVPVCIGVLIFGLPAASSYLFLNESAAFNMKERETYLIMAVAIITVIPFVLVNSRFTSLLILPFSVLAGSAFAVIKHYKYLAIGLVFMLFIDVVTVFSFFSYGVPKV
jgi:hypothetical protein